MKPDARNWKCDNEYLLDLVHRICDEQGLTKRQIANRLGLREAALIECISPGYPTSYLVQFALERLAGVYPEPDTTDLSQEQLDVVKTAAALLNGQVPDDPRLTRFDGGLDALMDLVIGMLQYQIAARLYPDKHPESLGFFVAGGVKR